MADQFNEVRVGVLGKDVSNSDGWTTTGAQAGRNTLNTDEKIPTRAINALADKIGAAELVTDEFGQRFTAVVGEEAGADKTEFDAIGKNIIQAVHDLIEGGGGAAAMPEPPDDDKVYGRAREPSETDGEWREITDTLMPEPPDDDKPYARVRESGEDEGKWEEVIEKPEPNDDGKVYGRVRESGQDDGKWEEIKLKPIPLVVAPATPVDLNDCKAVGFYDSTVYAPDPAIGPVPGHIPPGFTKFSPAPPSPEVWQTPFHLLVESSADNNRITQTLTVVDARAPASVEGPRNGDRWRRGFQSNTWSEWKKVWPLEETPDLTSHSYTELVTLMQNGELRPGALYEMSDYITRYRMPFLYAIKTVANGEPLILKAVTEKTFSPIVYSETYPNDVIYYDITDNRCEDESTPRTGFIQRRIDTRNNIDCPHDWRAMVWPRFKADLARVPTWNAGDQVAKHRVYRGTGGRLYIAIDVGVPDSITDRRYLIDFCGEDEYIFTGPDGRSQPGGLDVPIDINDYAERYTFNADTNNRNKAATSPPSHIHPSLVLIASGNATSLYLMGTKHRFTNTVFTYGNFGSRPRLIVAEAGFRNNSFYQTGGFGDYYYCMKFSVSCHNNIFFHPSYYNDFGANLSTNLFMGGTSNSRYGTNCVGNIFGSGYFNSFGENATDNIIVGQSHCNVAAAGFVGNVIKGWLDHCNFGNCFQDNKVVQGIKKSVFGTTVVGNQIYDFDSVTVGSTCMNNHWEFYARNESIGNCFMLNSFRSPMEGNQYGNDFKHNTIGNGYTDEGDSCVYNTFGNQVMILTIGKGCRHNRIANGTMHSNMGDRCIRNEIGSSGSAIILGNDAVANKIGNKCDRITFGMGCAGNTIGEFSSLVTFGEYCVSNIVGNICSEITFAGAATGNVIEGSCFSITCGSSTVGNSWGTRCTEFELGYGCLYNQFGNGCNDVHLGDISNDNVTKNHVTNLRMGYRCRNNQISANEVTLGNSCTDNIINRSYHNVTLVDNVDNVMMGFGTNENILINGDFRRPVNQGGQSIYTIPLDATYRYTIDMWEVHQEILSASRVELTNGGILFTAGGPPSSNVKATLRQWIEDPVYYFERALTYSILYVESGMEKIASKTFVIDHYPFIDYLPLHGPAFNGVIEVIIPNLYVGIHSHPSMAGATIKIVAIKLEVGKYSTIYDTRADYGKELLRCQRYQRVYGVNTIDTQRDTSPPMRDTPVIVGPMSGANAGKYLYHANL